MVERRRDDAEGYRKGTRFALPDHERFEALDLKETHLALTLLGGDRRLPPARLCYGFR